MAWTFEEIERIWLRGIPCPFAAGEVARAFDVAEKLRGRDWVLSTVQEHWGFHALWRVFWFGVRMPTLHGAGGADKLLAKLLREDSSADAELTAIHLLRSPDMSRALEVEPQVTSTTRRADFMIQQPSTPRVFVEVTQLKDSVDSEKAQALIGRIGDAVMAVQKPFIVEILVARDLTQAEEDETTDVAIAACDLPVGSRLEVGDYAVILVKAGDPGVVVPTVLDDRLARIATAKGLSGPLGRQVIVRLPSSDERAEDILSAEAKQLPPGECGLVMVDVNRQGSAFQSWAKLIPPRFTRTQHTRVAGVLLFACATSHTSEGLRVLIDMALFTNPYARVPLPKWIPDLVESARTEYKRLAGPA
jgi:hypothetical protein